MAKIKDGGPAFPYGVHTDREGMTLRDWFAGQALAGLLVDPVTYNGIAEAAYQFADAMLAERAK